MPFNRLPEDIVLDVLRVLDYKDIVRYRAVCLRNPFAPECDLNRAWPGLPRMECGYHPIDGAALHCLARHTRQSRWR